MNPGTDTSSVAADPTPRRLGRSAVAVSRYGLGGSGIGNLYRPMGEEEAFGTVRRALGAGMDLLDTAPYYGFGLSERRIGTALRHIAAAPVLSTKVGRVLDARSQGDLPEARHGFYSKEPFEPRFDYTYDGVLRSHESSLGRLGVERIDVLLCHDLGVLTHGEQHEMRFKEFIDEGYRAMRRLREEGTVGAIGLGVNECEICLQVLEHCDLDCILLAGRYTLLEQGALTALLPLCARRGISIIVGGPFNSGILAGGLSSDEKRYNYLPAPAAIIERVQHLARICAQHAVPLGAAALQFPLGHPQVAAVVAGCSSVAEVDRISQYMAASIPADLWSSLRAAGLLDADTPVPS